MKYSNFKIGDKVTPGYLNGNNKNFTHGKVYDVINVYHSDTFNSITVRNDKNKSQILNDFGSTFFVQHRPLKNLVNRFDGCSLADLATAKEYCILLLRRNTPHQIPDLEISDIELQIIINKLNIEISNRVEVMFK